MEASPAKSALEELRRVRKLHRATARAFSARIDAQISEVAASLAGEIPEQGSQLRDIRDMTTLMRQLEVKPAKGRRRDLKRIEVVVEELRHLVKSW